MPFRVDKEGDDFVVKTEGTGKVHGRHKSKKKALAQLRALYANVPEARNEPGKWRNR